MNRLRLYPFPLLFLSLALAGGCSHGNPSSSVGAASTPVVPPKAVAADQQELDQIPPPAKSRYMTIHTKESWGNPFLIVSKKTVNLRIMYPEAPQSNIAPGNLLHPVNARRRELDLRLSDLPEALAALPLDSWPYGRVIAVQEDPAEVHADRVQVRRNVEATIQMLNDLGVVVYEWPGNGMR